MTDGEHKLFVTLGASNHTTTERAQDDYYATDPKALELLLELESFSDKVWEPAAGGGHLSKVLEAQGHTVLSTDIVDRGYGESGIDFLEFKGYFDGDIVTNPPYSIAQQFVEKAIETITDGHRVAMLLKLQFLETKSRRVLFDKYPPHYIYVASSRINCCKNGDFSKKQKANNSALAYAWYIWDKPYEGETIVRWFN